VNATARERQLSGSRPHRVVDSDGGEGVREKERERERGRVAMSPADPTGAIADPGLAGRCRHQPTPFLPARSNQRRSHNFGDQRRSSEFFAALR